jgi:hypothetical protein
MMTENMDPIGKQSCRNHFTSVAGQLLTVPGKGNFFLLGNFENRVSGYAAIRHRKYCLGFGCPVCPFDGINTAWILLLAGETGQPA